MRTNKKKKRIEWKKEKPKWGIYDLKSKEKYKMFSEILR